MKLIYFDILPEEGLEYFYLWKMIDGSYTLMVDEEEQLEEDEEETSTGLTLRLLEQQPKI